MLSFIESIVEKSPDSIALKTTEGQKLSYKDLLQISCGVAKQILEFEIDKNTRIGLFAEDDLEMAVLLYGISSVCIAVPIDCGLGKLQYESLFKLLSLDFIATSQRLDESTLLDLTVMGIEAIQISHENTDNALNEKKSDDAIDLLLTTSGTTGDPKIVPLTRKNILVSAAEKIDRFELTDNDCALITSKLHRGTSINTMIAAHASGGSVLLANGFNLVEFIKICEAGSATWLTAPPTVLKSIASYSEENGLEFKSSQIRFIRSSGSHLPAKTRNKLSDLFSAQIIQTYGMTETRTIASTYGLDTTGKDSTAGIPFGNKVRIKSGEIQVKGDNVFPGYLNGSAFNRHDFDGEWFKTGDMGRLDDKGLLFIEGRIKEIINKGGEKVSPPEVENALEKHPSIENSVVFTLPGPEGIEEVGAALVLKRDSTLDATSLRSFLREYISPYKMPSIYYIAESLPLGQNGKYDRMQMHRLFEDKPILGQLHPHQRNNLSKMETLVKECYAQVLKLKNPDIGSNFFDMGGDSLSASLLHAKLVEKMDVDIPVHALFEYPSINTLSKYLESLSEKLSKLDFIIRLREGGYKKPLFIIHSADGNAVGYYKLAKLIETDRPVYGIQFKCNADWSSRLDFPEIAKKYVDEMKLVQPVGPYNITGICTGGRIAYEIAQELSKRKEVVELLAMFDAMLALDNVREIVKEDSLAGKVAKAFLDFGSAGFKGFIELFQAKATSFLRAYSTEFIILLNSHGLMKNKSKRAALKQAGRRTVHSAYEHPAVYFQSTGPKLKVELSADKWLELAPAMKSVKTVMTHNMFTGSDKFNELAELLNNELRNINE